MLRSRISVTNKLPTHLLSSEKMIKFTLQITSQFYHPGMTDDLSHFLVRNQHFYLNFHPIFDAMNKSILCKSQLQLPNFQAEGFIGDTRMGQVIWERGNENSTALQLLAHEGSLTVIIFSFPVTIYPGTEGYVKYSHKRRKSNFSLTLII